MTQETENQMRLRKARQAMEDAKRAADDARSALAFAEAVAKKAKEKYHDLFLKEEQQEFDRRRNAQ